MRGARERVRRAYDARGPGGYPTPNPTPNSDPEQTLALSRLTHLTLTLTTHDARGPGGSRGGDGQAGSRPIGARRVVKYNV